MNPTRPCAPLLRRAALLIAAPVALAVAGCTSLAKIVHREEARIDTAEAMAVFAGKLRPLAVPARWEVPSDTPEVDEIAPLPGGGVLVGLVQVEASELLEIDVYRAVWGPYVALDARTGAERWRLERERKFSVRHELLATDPVILVRSSDRTESKKSVLRAVDPRTGAELWRAEQEPAAAVALLEDRVVIARAAEQARVEALDLRTGKALWTQPGAVTSGTAPRITTSCGLVVELGAGIAARDPADGRLLWRSAAPSSVEGFPVAVPGGLVVAGPETVIRLDAGGATAWSVPLASARSLVPLDGKLLVGLGAKDDIDGIALVDLRGGQVVWRRATPGRVNSAIAISSDGTALAFTTVERVEVWGVASGKPRSSWALPYQLASYRLPDHVRIRGGRVVVVAEDGIGAFRLGGEEPLYFHALRGTRDRTFASELAILGNRTDVAVAPVGARSQPFTPVFDLAQQANIQAARFQVLAAQQSQSIVFSATKDDHSAGAIRARMAAVRRTHAAERSAARMEFATAVAGAVIGIAGGVGNMVFNAKAREKAATFRERREFALELARRAHEGALQEGFAVRPVRLRNGDGLLVVELATGRWAEIPTSPAEGSVTRDVFLDAQPALIADGSLVTKGIGLDPTRWRKRDLSSSVKIVERSLLSFDLPAVPLHPPAEYQSRSIGRGAPAPSYRVPDASAAK